MNLFILINKYKILIPITLQIFGIFLWLKFDPFLVTTPYNRGFQFFFIYSLNLWINVNLALGIDSLSLIFIFLTLFIFNICFYAIKIIKYFQFEFFLLLLGLEFIILLVFPMLDLFMFYLCFEGSLIPMFFIIGFWGSRARRIKAAFYLFLYTMCTALLTLISILYILIQVGSTFYPDLVNYNFTETEQKMLWFFFFLTFATKIPMIPFHIWLPEAHVEAPTIGSIILASILLKLGGFGCLRYLLPLYPYANSFYLPFIFTISTCSVVYASFVTIRQIDLKRIIAYPSIAHMNMVVIGIFSNNIYGIDGAVYLMVGHGIISSALFFLVGVPYDRYHTRILKYYTGLISVMPICGTFFLSFSLGNIGFPGTSNFIGEFLILVGAFNQNPFILFMIGSGVILSAVYSFWLSNRLFFGTLQTKFISFFYDVNFYEFYILGLFLFSMFFLGFKSNLILDLCVLNFESFLTLTKY